MPESRPISEGSISPAVILSYALMRGGGKLSPKLLAKLGRTTEAGVELDTARALASSGRPEVIYAKDVVKALVGADLFSGFMLQRPGTRRTLEKKVWGKESVEKLDQYRLLSSLGMPVDNDPRLGLNVVRTGRDRPAWARWGNR